MLQKKYKYIAQRVSELNVKQLTWLFPFFVFILVLPITHTVTLRLFALAFVLLSCFFVFKPLGFLRQYSLVIPFAIWAMLAIFSLFYTIDFEYTLGEVKNELGYVGVAFLGFYGAARYGRNFDVFLNIFMLSALMLVVWSLSIYMLEETWPRDARYGGVGGYSSYVVYIVPLLVLWGIRNLDLNKLLLVSLVLSGILFSAYLTQNRMFWLSLSVEFLTFASIVAVLKKYYWVIGIGLVLVLAGLWFGVSTRGGIDFFNFSWNEIRVVIEMDPRLSFWPDTVESIFAHPWYGHGFGRSIFDQAHPELVLNGFTDFHAHNIFLDAGVQLGVPGMLVLVWIFAALALNFWGYVRSADDELIIIGVVGLVFLAGVISKNMTDNFFIRHHSLFFWSVIGCLLGYGELLKQRYAAAPRPH